LPDKLLVLLILLLEFILILRVLRDKLRDLKVWVQVWQVIRLGNLVLMLQSRSKTKVAWVAVRWKKLTLVRARSVEQIRGGIQRLVNVRIISWGRSWRRDERAINSGWVWFVHTTGHFGLGHFKVYFDLFIGALDTATFKLLQKTLCILLSTQGEFSLALVAWKPTLYHWNLWLHTRDLHQDVRVQLLSDVHEHDYVWLFHFTLVLALGVLSKRWLGWYRDRKALWGHIHRWLIFVDRVVITSVVNGLAALFHMRLSGKVRTLLVGVLVL
jgi:hypothetical protein